MVGTITWERKGKAKESPKDPQPTRTKKKRRKLIPLVVGNYFTHNPSNVACMQIMRYNNNGRSRTSITCQCNLPLYDKG